MQPQQNLEHFSHKTAGTNKRSDSISLLMKWVSARHREIHRHAVVKYRFNWNYCSTESKNNYLEMKSEREHVMLCDSSSVFAIFTMRESKRWP